MNRNRLNLRAESELRSYLSLTEQFRQTWLIALIGCAGFLAGVFVLVWNEGKAVETTKSLEDAIQSVITVDPTAPFDPKNKNKLIHISGEIIVQEPLTEVDYGVSVMAVKLKRRVQMYQWVEEESKNVDSDGQLEDSSFSSFFYYTEWKDKLIDSSSFYTSMGHWNPTDFPLKTVTQVNDPVYIGDGNYKLGNDLKDKFNDFVPITSDERPERKDIKLHAGLYYHSHDVWNPEVGDVRIQFGYSGPHGKIVTVVGKLGENGEILPFQSPIGLTISILKTGRLSSEEIFLSEHVQNRVRTWLYRGGGWFLLYLGCVCLTTMFRSIVLRSRLLREILPISSVSLKMTISMAASLLTTAAAWMWYRPVFGLGLILVTILFLIMTRLMSRNQISQYQRISS